MAEVLQISLFNMFGITENRKREKKRGFMYAAAYLHLIVRNSLLAHFNFGNEDM